MTMAFYPPPPFVYFLFIFSSFFVDSLTTLPRGLLMGECEERLCDDLEIGRLEITCMESLAIKRM
jgi:hypothetical protein